MLTLLSKIYPEKYQLLTTTYDFNSNTWKSLLEKLSSTKNYDKGKAMENLANYFLSCIPGIHITGRNILHFTEEIDLCLCNYSNDSTLWELGSTILVECKNHKANIPAKTIRNLSYIMDSKGISSTFLFTASPLTKPALEEIEKAKNFGKHFIVFNLEDLVSTTSPSLVLKNKLEDTAD